VWTLLERLARPTLLIATLAIVGSLRTGLVSSLTLLIPPLLVVTTLRTRFIALRTGLILPRLIASLFALLIIAGTISPTLLLITSTLLVRGIIIKCTRAIGTLLPGLLLQRGSEALRTEGTLVIALLIAVITVAAVVALRARTIVADTRARRASCGPEVLLIAVTARGLLLVELVFVLVFDVHGESFLGPNGFNGYP
jgi:hypothetical protein